MRDFIIHNSKVELVKQIEEKCHIQQSDFTNNNDQLDMKSLTEDFRNIHKKAIRSTSDQLITQFGQDLLQASTKAKHLQTAIIRSVCDGLPKYSSNLNHTDEFRQYESAKGQPIQTMTSSDRRANAELESGLDKIVTKVRQKRYHSVVTI